MTIHQPHFQQGAVGRFTAFRRNIRRKIAADGFWGTVKHSAGRLAREIQERLKGRSAAPQDSFDVRYGTDTSVLVSVGALDIPDDRLLHANRYEPVQSEAFLQTLRTLPYFPEHCSFVDIGSGKGRALLLASHFPFEEIVGIELSAKLTAIALANIAIYCDPAQMCRNIRAECADALAFSLPVSNNVLYLYNPFDGNLMQQFVSRVEDSLRIRFRVIFVIYQWPLHRVLWDDSPCFRLVGTTQSSLIYESKPA